ncbi:type II toxin-antitoxin system RelE/ParE family toxin [Lentzea sp. HUAS12]|uniref:type II toxin-antitoxin system RelE/ParE family toxin n=1 Tax=Lentzea sp. HUAS12 TaxID=2951806 RepID=UPI0020A0B11F|nr:type II toxin-antitoxin system RelE/ParE family toxin [Lentzea sp. HUAS12]USX50617.1 type II toxin-antitoxin system RelE/ParE family toxin [Lentzea sp. HUAS12]
MAREWDYYTAPGGGCPVEKEMQKLKLSPWDAVRVEEAMDRVAAGEAMPGEVKYLRDDVLEIKIDGAQRTYRMLYAELDGGLVLLGLHFFAKKVQNARKDVDLAADRLRSWRDRA